MTPMKEDYLKIIFELGGATKMVSNKQIAISLNVAAGSVTEMVNKMLAENFVTHKPYSGVKLTDKGINYAEELVRKHRLWEVFLNRELQFDLPDVDVEAEKLEHVTSDKMIDHLDNYLGNPKTCPHGGVIPSKDGLYTEDTHLVLNDAEVGHEYTIARFIDNYDFLTYLSEIHLHLNDRILILDHDSFEGAVEIKRLSDGAVVNIGYKASHYIFVK